MKSIPHVIGPGGQPRKNPANPLKLLVLAGVFLVLCGSGCTAFSPGAANTRELTIPGGSRQTVLLLRVVTEVDGVAGAAFRSLAPDDDIWLGLADFSNGLTAKPASLHFLSDRTRLEGWVYLLLEPGNHYIAAHEPSSTNAFAHNARWTTCPRWSIDIQSGSRLLYGGTLFLPGTGRWLIFGPRMLVSFDETRLEVRDETATAEVIAKQWFPALLPMSVQLLKEHRPGDTMIIDTPPRR